MMPRRYLIGMLCGWALWTVLFAIAYAILERGTAILPESVVFRRILHWITVAAMPIAIGGWAYIWGDGPGQPPAWATTMWFSVVFGLVLYGALGAMAGAIYARIRRRRLGANAAS